MLCQNSQLEPGMRSERTVSINKFFFKAECLALDGFVATMPLNSVSYFRKALFFCNKNQLVDPNLCETLRFMPLIARFFPN